MEALTRRIDDLGRVVLPLDMRKALELEAGDYLDLFRNGKQISIVKNTQFITCDCCKEETNNLIEIGKIKLCEKCIGEIRNG